MSTPISPYSTSRGDFCSSKSSSLYSYSFMNTGPLLNGALGFGQMIAAFNFSYFYAYLLMPIAAAILAGLFYEFVFVKS